MRGLLAGLVLTLLAGLAVLAALLLRREAPASPAEAALAAAGVQLDLPDDAQVLRSAQRDGRPASALLALGDDRLRLRVTEGLDAGDAEARVQELRRVLEGLFEDRQAPYPGQLSNTLRCPERFRPEAIAPRGEALELVGLYANDRLGFGGCSEDLLRYRATVGYFYDPAGRRLLQLTYFADLDGPDAGPALLGGLHLSGGG